MNIPYRTMVTSTHPYRTSLPLGPRRTDVCLRATRYPRTPQVPPLKVPNTVYRVYHTEGLAREGTSSRVAGTGKAERGAKRRAGKAVSSRQNCTRSYFRTSHASSVTTEINLI